MKEQFKDIGDCPVESVEIERNPEDQPHRRSHVGELWVGAEWVNVSQARALRDWLNEVLP